MKSPNPLLLWSSHEGASEACSVAFVPLETLGFWTAVPTCSCVWGWLFAFLAAACSCCFVLNSTHAAWGDPHTRHALCCRLDFAPLCFPALYNKSVIQSDSHSCHCSWRNGACGSVVSREDTDSGHLGLFPTT